MNYVILDSLNKAQALDHLSKSIQMSLLVEAGIPDKECIEEIRKAAKEIAITAQQISINIRE